MILMLLCRLLMEGVFEDRKFSKFGNLSFFYFNDLYIILTKFIIFSITIVRGSRVSRG